ncbi:Calcium-binding mitochondrial carrier protein [Wickerhamomyces ciferrii]|uniref:Calcium-binding mitochondrial carrier protein n=1 Tax=Wickerhamomyces ciferrii (strain ATCC 14091 / BCRC 22168 / CBS 111 / JCM 3599 / NBRC 0793 / NRRL Y-1031 F-60-10) TaxID=1206466 RepID=K0KKX8_WICCF|nr:Calcium-binding mitochondrial carrier protein [Wickerhamomyces ciferrii]CCH43666.1 Calcium-binding mitochondrial carrier protein [Wickerhamomyces ciferrii]
MGDEPVDFPNRKSNGFTGGAVQVLIGQPFDLVKVRLQTGQFDSPITAFTSTLKNEGPKAFYKGTLAPLIGVGACVSVQFYAFHEARRQLLKKFGEPGQKELTLKQFYLAGAFAGIVNTPITAPVEQLRIILQTQPSGAKQIYKGPRDVLSKIYQTHGLKGIFRGFNVTLIREAQAYGVWFLTYEFLIQNALNSRNGIKRADISTPELLLYGALAGDALWLSSYPLDVIKSRVQSDGFGGNAKFKNSLDAAKQIWISQGALGFWRGIGPALVRAIPCSAGTFATVELTLRLLG